MIDGVLSEDTTSEIELNLKSHIIENSVLCSDGTWVYVNTAYFKGWIDGKMRGVAIKYLPHYLAWFRGNDLKLNFQQILHFAYGDKRKMEQSPNIITNDKKI